LTITDVFLNQMRVNVYEHTVKMASCEFMKRELVRQEGGREGGDGGKN
jgi:hypothetical protein